MIDRSGCAARRHGTMSAYTRHGCRCPDAREAQRLYVKRRRQGRPEVRKVPKTGTVRRLRALAVMGYNWGAISAETGLSEIGLRLIARDRGAEVYAATAAKVAGAFDRLSMVPGPSKRAATYARKNGWFPPLAWDNIDDPHESPKLDVGESVDEVLVWRFLAGYATPEQLNRLERAEVSRQLIAHGYTKNAVAVRLKASMKTVAKLLEEAA